MNESPVTQAANMILVEQIRQLIKERDEARREVCAWMNTDESGCLKSGSAETAIERGWDCFKEITKERDDALVDQKLIEELWERRTDAAQMNERIRQLLGNTEQLELTVARLKEDLRRMDAIVTLVFVSIEKRKLREEADYNNHQCRTTDGE